MCLCDGQGKEERKLLEERVKVNESELHQTTPALFTNVFVRLFLPARICICMRGGDGGHRGPEWHFAAHLTAAHGITMTASESHEGGRTR